MSNETFSRLMHQIGREADELRIAELKAIQRRALYRRLFKGVLILACVLAVGLAYAQRAEISQRWQQFLERKSDGTGSAEVSPAAKLASDLDQLRSESKKRDDVLNELAR